MKMPRWVYNPRDYAGKSVCGGVVQWSTYNGIVPRHSLELTFHVFSWWLSFMVSWDGWFSRDRVLANGDYVPYDEPIAADDYRNQPLRKNGLPW